MKRAGWAAVVLAVMLTAAPARAQPAQMAIPTDVQGIMDRMQHGQMPSADEQTRMSGWASGMMAGAGVGAPAQASGPAQRPPGGGKFVVGTPASENPCKKPAPAAGLNVKPSRADYLAMAQQVGAAYGGHLTAGTAGKLTAMLDEQPDPGIGSAMSLTLIGGGFGSAGVVAAAHAAGRNPTDAVTANNLGTALRGMHDYANAAIALRYAESLAPDSAVIANNLGWLAFGQGDGKAAKGFFKTAADKNPKMATVLLGQGLIAQCSGQSAQALKLLRPAMAAGYSPVTAAAIGSAEDDLANGGDDGGPDAYADSGSDGGGGGAGGGGGGGGGGGDTPNWQDPPFPPDAASMVGMMQGGAVQQYLAYWTDIVTQAAQDAAANGLKVQGGSSSASGSTITFQRGNDQASFVLGDLRHIINGMIAPVEEKWITAAADTERMRNGCRTCPAGGGGEVPSCSAWRIKAEATHRELVPEEKADWTQERKSFDDLYAFSQPWLKQIRDPARAAVEAAAMKTFVASHGGAFAQAIELWGQEMVGSYGSPGGCQPPPPKTASIGTLKPYKVDPTQCHSGAMKLNFVMAKLSADCDKMSLSFSEGVLVNLNLKFAPDYVTGSDGVMRPASDWSNDQLTIFVGVGDKGAVGALNGSVSAGAYVTLQNGSMIDYGGQSGGEVSIDASGVASAKAGATTQISAISGPDVTTSSGTSVKGAGYAY